MDSSFHTAQNSTTRREFLKTSSKAVVGAALTAAIARPGYTAEANTIQVALVGSGGRGHRRRRKRSRHDQRPDQVSGHGGRL
jgi:hypothetical protein